MRSDKRQSSDLRPVEIVTGYLITAEGSALIKVGNTHVLCAASVEETVPAVPAQLRQRLGDRRILDAPARHLQTHAARSRQRPPVRPHARDPAAHRPLPALRGRHEPPGRAHRHHRLRRPPGRRRHPHGVDHRRLRRAGAGLPPARRVRAIEDRCRSATPSPRPASASSAAFPCSTSATRRTRRPMST